LSSPPPAASATSFALLAAARLAVDRSDVAEERLRGVVFAPDRGAPLPSSTGGTEVFGEVPVRPFEVLPAVPVAPRLAAPVSALARVFAAAAVVGAGFEAAGVDGFEAAAVDGFEAAAVDGFEAAAVDGFEAAADFVAAAVVGADGFAAADFVAAEGFAAAAEEAAVRGLIAVVRGLGFAAGGWVFEAGGREAVEVAAVADLCPPASPGLAAPTDDGEAEVRRFGVDLVPPDFARAVRVDPGAAPPVFVPAARTGSVAAGVGRTTSLSRSPPRTRPARSAPADTAALPIPTAVSRMLFGFMAMRCVYPAGRESYTARAGAGSSAASPQAIAIASEAEIRSSSDPSASRSSPHARPRAGSQAKSSAIPSKSGS
jgi:hypothetical protein